MKKRYVLSAIAAFGTARMFLKRKKRRERLMDDVAEMRYKNELGENISHSIDAAGKPDQSEEHNLEQLENAKMMAEGSQFGVQYYNDLKSREPESK